MTRELKHKFVLTEKTTLLREQNKIVISTNKLVDQKDIVAFVENKFETKVLKVNSMNIKGKTKVRRRAFVKLQDRKKFYLTLENLSKFE